MIVRNNSMSGYEFTSDFVCGFGGLAGCGMPRFLFSTLSKLYFLLAAGQTSVSLVILNSFPLNSNVLKKKNRDKKLIKVILCGS